MIRLSSNFASLTILLILVLTGAVSGQARNFAGAYVGGSGSDACLAVATDAQGHVYVAGYTDSPDFPVCGAGRDARGGKADVFVLKLDRTRQQVLAAARVGGDEDDIALSLACDTRGAVYVAGTTASKNFPVTSGACCRTYLGGSQDIFVMKMDGDLRQVLASTYLGGSGRESGWIGLAPTGRVVLVGATSSRDLPTTSGAYATAFRGGANDGFVAELDADLKAVRRCTYIGGSEGDQVGAFAFKNGGNAICLCGNTSSRDFPISARAFRRTTEKGFIATLSADLASLESATYFPGFVSAICASANGDVTVAGHGGNALPRTPGAFHREFDRHYDQGYIANLSPDLAKVKAATLLPGSWTVGGGAICPRALALNRRGEIICAGTSSARDFPTTPGAFSEIHQGGDESEWGGDDVFVLRMAVDLSSIAASTLLGGRKNDMVSQVVCDHQGHVFVAGSTTSTDFPTTPASTGKYGGGDSDGFVARFNLNLAADRRDEFAQAAKTDDQKTLQRTLERPGDWIVRRDQAQRTALHGAAQYGAVGALTLLLRYGAEVDAHDAGGNTPLHLACLYGRTACVDRLLKNHANLNGVNGAGESPVYLATWYGNDEVLKLLLANGADSRIPDKRGFTPVHLAAVSEKLTKLQLLLNDRADLAARNQAGDTPLLAALKSNSNLEVISLLLFHGADLKACDAAGNNALLVAASAKLELIALLLKSGLPVNSQDSKGNTALHKLLQFVLMLQQNRNHFIGDFAGFLGQQQAKVNLYLEYGADPALPNQAGRTPLDLGNEIGDAGINSLLKREP